MANERAETKEKQRTTTQQEQQRGTTAPQREERNVPRRESAPPAMPAAFGSPFSLMRRFMEDLDLLFEGFSPAEKMWIPPVEVLERDGQLVVRAEVPGLSKDQVNVEFGDGQLVISGERRQEHDERRGGVYRSERVFGTFHRSIPLPEGVDPEQAKAAFKNGVLEITMPAPERPRARRIEIQESRQQPEARSA